LGRNVIWGKRGGGCGNSPPGDGSIRMNSTEQIEMSQDSWKDCEFTWTQLTKRLEVVDLREVKRTGQSSCTGVKLRVVTTATGNRLKGAIGEKALLLLGSHRIKSP